MKQVFRASRIHFFFSCTNSEISVKSPGSENRTNMHHLHVKNELNEEFWQNASLTDKFLWVVKGISASGIASF